jgi:hypothetical protein
MRITFYTNSNKLYLLPTIYCLGEEYYAEFGITFLIWGVAIVINGV